MTREQYIENLNSPKKSKRLSAVKKLKKLEKRDESLKPSEKPDGTNVQLHSFYSFSPYSPSKAAYMAYKSGLLTMGISDHDTLAGAAEFIKACKILQRAYSIGFECRVKVSHKSDKQESIHILACGLPDSGIKSASGYLEALRKKRLDRMSNLTAVINKKLAGEGIAIDFAADVLPLSMIEQGGSVTERHIFYALAQKLIKKYSKGENIVRFLEKNGYETDDMQKALLSDESNPFYGFDLAVALKGSVKSHYKAKDGECEELKEFNCFVKALGGFTACQYHSLGNLPLDGLDGFAAYLKESGVQAIAYSPSHTDKAAVDKLQTVCEKYALMEIDGDAINAPRQKFGNLSLTKTEFSKMAESSWAIIGHSKMVNLDKQNGMFTEKAVSRSPLLKDRIALYAQIGKSGYIEQ